MKRWYLVLGVLVAVALATAAIVVGFYQIENWRGARAWSQVQHELAARGESLEPKDFIPPPVSDGQNLAMIPLFAKALDYRVDPQTNLLTFGSHRSEDTLFRDMPYGHNGGKPISTSHGGWESGHVVPLEDVQEYYAKRPEFAHPVRPGTPSDDVLLALTKFAPALAEIEQAAAVRPQARFPVNWLQVPPSNLALPQDNLVRQTSSVLRLRAMAQLAAGRHAEAARDLATAFRLRASIRSEPTLIAHLTVITCDGILLQPIWEGLAARRWTADELLEIQAELRSDDLLSDYTRTIRGERAIFFCRTMDLMRKAGTTRGLADVAFDHPDDPARNTFEQVAALYPRGWIDRNEASGCLAYQECVTGVLDLKTRRIFPGRVKASEEQRKRDAVQFSPTNFLTRIIMPVVQSIIWRTAHLQSACEQAETACALERYFLEHQMYPETLDTLVPAFLDRVPIDLIDGAPMRYRRTADGRYLLYGIGWNGRDDGGTVAWKGGASKDYPAGPDDKEGDWVWQYAPLDPPAGMY